MNRGSSTQSLKYTQRNRVVNSGSYLGIDIKTYLIIVCPESKSDIGGDEQPHGGRKKLNVCGRCVCCSTIISECQNKKVNKRINLNHLTSAASVWECALNLQNASYEFF